MNYLKSTRFIVVLTILLPMMAAYAETVEVVVFKSKQGASEESVRSAAKEMLMTLQSWDGFISRELISVGDGVWIDVVKWQDRGSALAAQRNAKESDSCLLFFSLLEQDGQQIFHGEKVLSQ
jgi:hypothetical protein